MVSNIKWAKRFHRIFLGHLETFPEGKGVKKKPRQQKKRFKEVSGKCSGVKL